MVLVETLGNGPTATDFTRSSSARLGYNSHHLDEASNQMIQSVNTHGFPSKKSVRNILDWLINIY